jgi:ketosteroid isomerase-like protein
MATAAPASTASIGQELVSLCREGRNIDAVNRLYSPAIVTIEASGSPDMPAEQTGIEAVRAKHQWWEETFDVNKMDVQGPFVGENQFAVRFDFETTAKATGERKRMTEMALYTVKDGRIVREQFFYNPAG